MHEFIDAGLDAHWSSTLAEATGTAKAPFSAVVRTSGVTIYTAGQTFPVIGANDTRPAAEVSLREQTEACLINIDLLLTAAGATRSDVVKVTIFNTVMSEQPVVNEVYREFFGDHRPTRSHVEVTRLADPDLLIEIEAIAVVER
ncbi:RidA family protein [soil metagenome]